MSQFGNTSKNPPWVRSTQQQSMSGGVTPQQLQSQLMTQMGQASLNPVMVQYQQQQQVYQQMQQQQPMQQISGVGGHGQQQSTNQQQQVVTSLFRPQMSNMGNMGQSMSPMVSYPQAATVSYPTPRALNPSAFNSPATPVPPTNSQPSPKQRVFTGTVTKVHDNFGFVDEDVFFQTSCCVKGMNPTVGDRVLVEASFNPTMPFKWNATRIQVLPMSGGGGGGQQAQRGQQQGSGGGYNAVPPPLFSGDGQAPGGRGGGGQKRPRSMRSKDRDNRGGGGGGGRDDDGDDADRKKRREERQRDRDDKDKQRGNSPPPSGGSRKVRSKSPRPAPRRRARVVPRYMVQVPKIALDMPEADVLELRRRYTNMYIPSDFFSTSIRWVDAFPPHNAFTLDRPCAFHVMNKEVDPPVENDAVLEPADADYLFSAKVMLMSMPSTEEMYRKCCSLAEDKDKDGNDERDLVHPTRLTSFLVGLRGKNETMAVGGPWSPSLDGPNPEKDPAVLIKTAVRSCKALTGIDLSHCTQWYRFVELYYRRGETTHKGKPVPARVETVVIFLPDVWSCLPTRLEMDDLRSAYKTQLERKLGGGEGDSQSSDDTKDKDDSVIEIKKEPTHFSELDPKTMKVSELRSELEARTMSPKGLKSQLIARLTKAIKTESDKDEEEGKKADEEPEIHEEEEDKETEEKSKKEEEDKKKQDERERVAREKRYAVPETPHILVHPSKTAKGGKFDCTVMSLSLLLDYRPEDTKEHSFEVSLFAELFNEMLMRDHGFRIYRAMHFAPEPVKEEKKDKEREKKDEKKDDKEGKKDDKDKDAKKEDKDGKKRDDKKDDRTSSKDKRDDSSRRAEEKEDKDEDEDEEDEDEDDVSQSSKSKDTKEEKEKKKSDKDKKRRDRPKLFTEDPSLLLSFVYFDTSHCGYIFDKDIEELLYTLGLNLSRAQVRKLVQKVVLRDSLHYRKLTDKPKLEEVKEGEEKPAETAEPVVAESKESMTMLAYGNKHLLPVFKDASPPSKRARKDDKDKPENVPPGYVMYKGGLLDVDKLTAQLKRSEQARKDTEARMITTRDQLESLKTRQAKSESEVARLSTEVAELTAQLASTRAELTRVTTRSTMFRETLREIGRIGETALRSLKEEPKENGQPETADQQQQQIKQDTRWSGPNNGVVVKAEPQDPENVTAEIAAAVVEKAPVKPTSPVKVAAVKVASPVKAAAAAEKAVETVNMEVDGEKNAE